MNACPPLSDFSTERLELDLRRLRAAAAELTHLADAVNDELLRRKRVQTGAVEEPPNVER